MSQKVEKAKASKQLSGFPFDFNVLDVGTMPVININKLYLLPVL